MVLSLTPGCDQWSLAELTKIQTSDKGWESFLVLQETLWLVRSYHWRVRGENQQGQYICFGLHV